MKKQVPPLAVACAPDFGRNDRKQERLTRRTAVGMTEWEAGSSTCRRLRAGLRSEWQEAGEADALDCGGNDGNLLL